MTTLVARDPRKIQRVALNHTDDVEASLRGKVLAEAYKSFGYVGESFGARGPLAKTLVRCGITPLDTAQVEQYKASKVSLTEDSGKKWDAAAWAILLGAVCFVWNMYIWPSINTTRMAGGDYNDWVADTVFSSFMTILASLFLIGCVWYSIIRLHIPKHRRQKSWVSYTLGGPEKSKYHGYIPIHVLNLALQVKNSRVAASFVVDELTLSVQQVPRPLPDPFLKVTLGSEFYYIAVWDEREFEAKM
jgi:hypothetical protein